MPMGTELALTPLEKYLGFVLDSSVKIPALCLVAAKRSNSMLRIVRSKDNENHCHISI